MLESTPTLFSLLLWRRGSSPSSLVLSLFAQSHNQYLSLSVFNPHLSQTFESAFSAIPVLKQPRRHFLCVPLWPPLLSQDLSPSASRVLKRVLQALGPFIFSLLHCLGKSSFRPCHSIQDSASAIQKPPPHHRLSNVLLHTTHPFFL